MRICEPESEAGGGYGGREDEGDASGECIQVEKYPGKTGERGGGRRGRH